MKHSKSVSTIAFRMMTVTFYSGCERLHW